VISFQITHPKHGINLGPVAYPCASNMENNSKPARKPSCAGSRSSVLITMGGSRARSCRARPRCRRPRPRGHSQRQKPFRATPHNRGCLREPQGPRRAALVPRLRRAHGWRARIDCGVLEKGQQLAAAAMLSARALQVIELKRASLVLPVHALVVSVICVRENSRHRIRVWDRESGHRHARPQACAPQRHGYLLRGKC
jgi:hypothetical protein